MFTLLEIIVAMVLLSLVILGMLSVFVGGARHTVHSRERLSSAEVGKYFVDQMQNFVRQDIWDTVANPLSLTSAFPLQPPLTSQVLNNRTFSGTYITTPITNSDARRVIVTVNWTEPSS